MRSSIAILVVLAAFATSAGAGDAVVCADCVLGHIAYLAAPERKGRQCATTDEAAAAEYLAGQLRASGVRGAEAGGGFVQTVPLTGLVYATPPILEAGALKLRYRDSFVAAGLRVPVAGPLLRISDPAQRPADLKGAIVLYAPEGPTDLGAAAALRSVGAAAVLVIAPPEVERGWDAIADRPPGRGIAGAAPASAAAAPLIFLRPAAGLALLALPPRSTLSLTVTTRPYSGATHNVVGVIHGRGPQADRDAVLLSAHYDHLGVLGGQLYPGANDDASGTAAVLEFARILAAGPAPRRTVYFALFGCEEAGGYGASWYRAHPPGGRLDNLAANLEFEMIGFPDPKRPDALMLTGWERSNLGPALAAHGAKLGPDLYPEGNFFRRSDNYALAEKGVVAHTISAWPTPPTYHDPSDTFASLDGKFAVSVIASLVGPIRWLVDSDFKPSWTPGGRP